MERRCPASLAALLLLCLPLSVREDGSRGSSTFCHVTDFSSSRDGPYHAVPLASTPAEVARHTDHGQPFLARRVSQDWLASRLWSHAYFHQLFRGHDLFSSTFSTAAAPQFTPDYPNHAVYYGIFLNNATLAALVATDYQYPHFIPQSMRLRGNEWVHWGHPPCGAKRHMDLTCTARVSVQVRGRKRWRLYPLTTSPAWSQVLRPLEVVLGPGDALVWFPGWEHETGIEAGPSVSLSLHFTPNHSSHYISSFPELLSARVSKTCNWGQPK
jgi:hypothetical protein